MKRVLPCAVALSFCLPAAGQTASYPASHPLMRGSRSSRIGPAALAPAAIGLAAGPPPSQPPTAVFAAELDNNTFIPPDTMGVPGPLSLVVMQNEGAQILNRTGSRLWPTSGAIDLIGMWQGLLSTTLNGPFDPHVVYDEASQRFYAVALDGGPGAGSQLLIAVSKSSNPATITAADWTARSYLIHPGCAGTTCLWGDYPQVGLNANWFVFGVNLFDSTAALVPAGVQMWVFNKTQAASAGGLLRLITSTATAELNGNVPAGNVPFTMIPALTYDSGKDIFLVDADYLATTAPFAETPWTTGGNSALRLSRLTATGCPGASPCVLGTQIVQFSPNFTALTQGNFNPPQPSTTALLDVGDGRVINVVERNNQVWAAFTAGFSGRAAAAWADFDVTGAPFLNASGLISDPTLSYFYPSVAVDAFGDVLVGFSGSSPSQFPSGYYVTRSTGQAAFGAPYLYKAGLAKYFKPQGGSGLNRWGDYSATAADPGEPGAFWTVQEYAEARNTCASGFDCFGTEWARVEMIPPVTSSPTAVVVSTTAGNGLGWTWGLAPGATAYHLYDGSSFAFVASTPTTAFAYANPAQISSNAVAGLIVRGANAVGEGPAAPASFGATLAVPYSGGALNLTPHPFSVDVYLSTCAPSPPAASCEGYQVDSSTDPLFGGALFSSATVNAALSTLTVSGLTPFTTYYVRIANLNPFSVPDYGVLVSTVQTLSNVLRPDPSPPTNITASQIRLNWQSGGNPPSTSYDAKIFLDAARTIPADPDGGGLNVFSALFQGLTANTSYYFRVIPQQGAMIGPALDTGPYETDALPPGLSTTPFTNMATGQFTVNWTTNTNGSGALYQAELSPASDFSSSLAAFQTLLSSQTFPGLVPNRLYYARAKTINFDGSSTAYTTLGSTRALASPPSTFTFSALGQTSFVVSYDSANNDAGQTYLVQASTSPTFGSTGDVTVSAGAALSALLTGLKPNTTYFVQAQAINSVGASGSFSMVVASTVTLPAPPVPAATLVSSWTVTTLAVQWRDPGNGPGTSYVMEASFDPMFASPPVQSLAVATASGTFTGLTPNTSYYVHARTVGFGTDPPSAFTPLGTGSTLANPIPAPPALVSVTYTSVTVQWTALPLAPTAASCEGYRVDVSTDPGFGGVIYSAAYPNTASRGGVANIPAGTTFSYRVASINFDGVGNPVSGAGTFTTLPQNIVTSSMTSAGVQLSIAPLLPPWQRIIVNVPPGAFPVGVPVTLNTSVELGLPPALTNEAATVSLGSGAGWELRAAGLQPQVPVLVQLAYTPPLPANVSDKDVQVARFDQDANQWTVLPTSVDPVAHTITAPVSHFSLFAAFGVAAASDLGSVNIFPIPWMPTSTDSRFNAPTLTISNLPSSARARLFTVTGELVWQGNAPDDGILTWDGKNRFGRGVSSGTYLIVLEGAGRKIVKRAVVVK